MRKIILNVAVSLDGYIEGPNGEFDWCFTDQDYGFHEFLNSIDVVFYGRKSYQLFLDIGQDFFKTKRNCVFSNTLKQVKPGIELIKAEWISKVQEIKAEGGKDIWLFGGAKLLENMMNANLVDEFHLSIHPILLGDGTPLFTRRNARIPLKLKSTKNYSSGLVQNIYVLDRG